MPRITKVFASGKMGPVIFYEMGGKSYVRARPKKVKQTKATKASASLFGQASRLSALLRAGLATVLSDPREKGMMYRLNHVLFLWLQAGMPAAALTASESLAIDKFEFNEDFHLPEKLREILTVEWKDSQIIIHIPAFIPTNVMTAPARTKTVHLNIGITGCQVKNSGPHSSKHASIDLPYNTKEMPAQKIELAFKRLPRSINVIVAGLNYTTEKTGKLIKVTDTRWWPCRIISMHTNV